MSEKTTCPNCYTQFKSSFFGSNVQPLDKAENELINLYSGKQPTAFCTKCGTDELNNSKTKMSDEQQTLIKNLRELLHYIPVITIQLPLNWDYNVIGMVTGQSITGTGVISELTSSFTDLFGLQSERYNTKLRNGENLCLHQLRVQALEMNANAVIGTDIDYSEVGGDKGMLMVCMSGTAVYLRNIGDVLPSEVAEKINDAKKLNEQLKYLNGLAKKVETAIAAQFKN